jgi:hypothetical protein
MTGIVFSVVNIQEAAAGGKLRKGKLFSERNESSDLRQQ